MGKMHFHILFFRFIRVDLAGLLWYVIYAKKIERHQIRQGGGGLLLGLLCPT